MRTSSDPTTRDSTPNISAARAPGCRKELKWVKFVILIVAVLSAAPRAYGCTRHWGSCAAAAVRARRLAWTGSNETMGPRKPIPRSHRPNSPCRAPTSSTQLIRYRVNSLLRCRDSRLPDVELRTTSNPAYRTALRRR
jgi:hypothetical protein